MTAIARHLWLVPALLASLVAQAHAANHVVTVGGRVGPNFQLVFTPAALTINVGDTVTFNNAAGFHNVVANNGSFRCANGCDGVGTGNGNPSEVAWSSTVTFNNAGTVEYFCDAHLGAGMTGSITVQGGTPPPPPPPPPPTTIGAGFTGAWYNPAEDGHGMFLEILPQNVMVAAWYMFTPAGQPVWIVGSGPITGNTAAVEAIIATGGRFIPNFNPTQIVRTPWGRMNFTFTSCNAGRMDFVSTVAGYGSGTMPLTRLTLPAGSACAPPAAQDAQDLVQ